MDVYRERVLCEGRSNKFILGLFSDLHLDASDHDEALLKKDLDIARKLGARISINGDMFDAIVPGDKKRHHPRVSAVQNRDDIFNQVVSMAVERLKPYADLIDVMAPGNHERSILKHNHLDLVSMVIGGLSQYGGKIHQGSYRGFQQYIFKYKTSHAAQVWTMFRHHGAGGNAPVTGGALDLDRLRKDFDADCYWIGHKHQSIDRNFTRFYLSSRGVLKKRQQKGVISGGYKKQLVEVNPGVEGDQDNFSERFYGVSQQGAKWVYIETWEGSGTNDVEGIEGGLRWTVFDSPYPLLSVREVVA